MSNEPLRFPDIEQVLFSRDRCEDGTLGHQAYAYLVDGRVIALGVCHTEEDCQESVREFYEMRDAIRSFRS